MRHAENHGSCEIAAAASCRAAPSGAPMICGRCSTTPTISADAGRHVRRAVLVKRRRRDAVGQALHDERPLGNRRQQKRAAWT